MKIINPPDKVIMQLTGSKVYDRKLKYRLLKWVGVIQVDEENESHLKIFGKPERGTILHNYITGETLYFEPEEDFRDYMERLVKGLFFVPYDHDDEKTVHQLRSALRLMNTKKDVTSFKILTTTDCNARCFYCYESGIKKHDMSLETADKVVEYIIKKSGKKKVTLAWFGGEPLMGTEVIDRICSSVKEAGMEYISVMTSNGYLFDDEMIIRAKERWHLNNIQITLDGTEEVYNRVKAYKDAKDNESPFRRVMGNIKDLAGAGVRVNIRLNLTKENFGDLKKLLDEISEMADILPDRKKINVYASPLFEDMEKDDGEKEKLITNTDILTKMIRERGLESRSYKAIKLRISGCMADNDAHRGISPIGDIIKCEHHIYDKIIGSIEIRKGLSEACEPQPAGDFGYNEDDEMIREWKKPMESGEICDNCPAFPSCYRLKNCPVSHICSPGEKKQQLGKNESLILQKTAEVLRDTDHNNTIIDKNKEMTKI